MNDWAGSIASCNGMLSEIWEVNEYAEYVGSTASRGFERVALPRKHDALRIFFKHGGKQSTCQTDETCQAAAAAGADLWCPLGSLTRRHWESPPFPLFTFSFAIRNPGREMRQSSRWRWGSYTRG